jgi:hypothetical protein
MKKINISIAIFLLHLNVFATGQVGDILIWKGDTLTLFSNPLKLITGYDSLILKIHLEIEQLTYLNLKANEEREEILSTACWRGYKAEWSVLNDSIFLNNIYHCHNKNIKINLYDIFQNIEKNEKIFASWINGDLILPQGNCIEFVNLDYRSIYEQETVLNVESGLLKDYEIFHNQVVKRSAFFKNAKLGEVYEFTSKNINWDILPDVTNKLIRVHIGVQLNEQGQIENIDEEYTYLEEMNLNAKTQIITNINNIFIEEGIRIAKLITDWDVIYQRGNIVGRSLMIDFSEENKKKYYQK